MSGPLPKMFGRKKSARDLNGVNTSHLPIGADDLVPVLDDLPGAPTPTRVISGRRVGKPEDENKAARNCMCCDSKLSVPRDLEKFRCQVCTTVNDLKPIAEQRDGKKELEKQAGAFPHGIKGPLSVERTKMIIDRCVLTYLEERCRKREPPAQPPTPALGTESLQQSAKPILQERPASAFVPIKARAEGGAGKQLVDPPLSSSPPDAPKPVRYSATITDLRELDPFGYMRIDTPPPNRPQPNVQGPVLSKPPSTPSQAGPSRVSRKPPPAPLDVSKRAPSQSLRPQGSSLPNGMPSPRPQMSPRHPPVELKERQRYERVKTIFRPLEDYIVAAFGDHETLNTAFSTTRPAMQGRARSESSIKTPPPEPVAEAATHTLNEVSELDPKMLLLGDLGENSSWWVGKLDRVRSDKQVLRKKGGEGLRKAVSSKSPNINWPNVSKWYHAVTWAGLEWQSKVEQIKADDDRFDKSRVIGPENVIDIDEDLEEARQHAIRTLFKVTENILKRPTQPLREAEHLRFLLIILANPSLYPSSRSPSRADFGGPSHQPTRSPSGKIAANDPASPERLSPRKSTSREHGTREHGTKHTGILKRIFGLIANSSDSCQRYLISWLSRYDEDRFELLVNLVASFVTHRICRRSNRPRSKSGLDDGGLIPDLSGSAANTSAQLHSALGLSSSLKKSSRPEPDGETEWASDWQVKAAAKVMSLLFAANNIWQGKRTGNSQHRVDSAVMLGSTTPQAKAARSGQLMHTSQFYNLMLDYQDLISDFNVWEKRRDKFAFCQYPLFLSMATKIKILEYDARRQMEIKAREAYFDSVIRQRALDQYLHLRVRRDCMVDDSLRQISEAVGQGSEELKKGLRVQFTGEEGVDAGGLRKEWFLMLVRDIFDPEHGMFVYDDDSHTCYFNSNSFETSDQYHLVGVLLGLAIYNSTILDVALPPFAFRKLLAAAPSSSNNANISVITGTKGQMTYTIADLAEFRPSLAAGLQQLLDFDGDVQETYCRDFVAPVERYGTITNVPLIPNGEGTAVTNENRQEFVDAYIRYLLDTSVTRQFEPFKRGFFTVCAGNALSLFRAEEIELLVRGSDEQLDVDSLRAVAVYENWRHFQPPHSTVPDPAESVPVIQWFWELFASASPDKQRKLLTFITGSDRIPAVGATSLVLRIVAGGDGWGGGGEEERQRFPVARTCFNMLVLWRYDYREALEERLWRAVEESEGFGLK